MTTTEIPLSQGKVALVDAEDLPLVGQFKWYAQRGPFTFYAARSVYWPGGRRTRQLLHTLLTGWPMVDHRDGDGLDNRRANLRPASKTENNRNARKRAGSSSHYKGVTWFARGSCWRARIDVSGHQRHLGLHSDESDAARAYDQAARLCHGEFAALNFPLPDERCALDTAVLIGASI